MCQVWFREEKLDQVKQLKEELKTQIDEITKQIEDMSNLGFESKKEIEMLNSDINVATARIANNNENKERFEKEIEESKQKAQELEDEMKQREEKKINLKQNKQ